MSHSDSIRYCPVPAYFVPVVVSLAEDPGPRDALEEAVAAIVALDRGFPQELAQILCVAPELVESALAELELRHILKRPDLDGPYVVNEQTSHASRPRQRPGYVLWDLLSNQPTFQLVIGEPLKQPYVPKHIDVVDATNRKPRHAPSHRAIERSVRSLPDVPDLRIYVPLGHAYRSVESAHVQKIAFEARRHPISGHAFVPIEFRPECEPIVWRPMLAPSAQIETSLDPQGYSGLLQRVPEARAELDRIRLELDPKLIELLAAEGYRNAAELFQDADRRVQNELVGAWGNPGWREVQDTAVDAMRQTILSRFLRSSPNGGMHAWADVLERAVRVLLVQFLDAAAQDAWARLDKDKLTRILDERARKLGQLRERLLESKDLKPGKKDGLLKVLDKGTLGSRLLGLVAVWVADPRVFDQLAPALREQPDFFRRLDDAIEMRNRVIHPDGGESPNARAFRGAVLGLVKAMMQVQRS